MTRERKLASTVGIVSLATMLSRILGLAREQLFAALMGASMFSDAFRVAFKIPNLLRDLFAEGALSQAFIPTFKKISKEEGLGTAFALANRVAGTLLVILGLIVLIAGIFAPQIVTLLAEDFALTKGKFDLTVYLTRLMLPFLPIVSMAAIAMGMLNSCDRFSTPALAPAIFNVVAIIVGSILYLTGVEGRLVAIGWAIGTVLGGVFQMGIQLPALWRLGYRPKLRADLLFTHPGVRQIGKLMLPAIAGLAAVQLNIVVNTAFASQEAGAVSWLDYAFRFLQLPIGVFGVAIATVSTARYADAAADNNPTAIADHLESGLRLVLFLTVPSVVGLVLLDEAIIRLIYERGKFSAADTIATARALRMFAVGLVAYASVKVLAPAFYAVNKARVAVYASVSAVIVNIAISTTLYGYFGYRILAFGIACGAIMNFSVLYFSFHRKVARIRHLALLGAFGKVALASLVMGAAVWFSHKEIAARLDVYFTDELLIVFGPILIGAFVYALATLSLGLKEARDFASAILRRGGK